MDTTQSDTLSRPRAGRRAGAIAGLALLLISLLTLVLAVLQVKTRMPVYWLASLSDARRWYDLEARAESIVWIVAISGVVVFLLSAVVLRHVLRGKAMRFYVVAGLWAFFMALFILPVMQPAREKNGPSDWCVVRQRELCMYLLMCAQDNGEYYPAKGEQFPEKMSSLDSYLRDGQSIEDVTCPWTERPFHRRGGYGMNGQIAGMRYDQITRPDAVVAIADSTKPGMLLFSKRDIAFDRHGYDSNRWCAIGFLDGHVERHATTGTVLKWK